MKALVPEEYNKLVFKDVPDPEIQSNEVLVRVKACGMAPLSEGALWFDKLYRKTEELNKVILVS